MSSFRLFGRRNSSRRRTSSSGFHTPPDHHPDPLPQDGAGNTIATTDYARRCREIMQLYNDLRNLGVDEIFDIPRVVVIGGQSSGKSSLVEAVSGINVPRDSGTCTRCPMECTMSSQATQWSCTIEISRAYDSNGFLLDTHNPKDLFGPPIYDKSQVDLWIRRAQAAVLGPHREPADFYTMSKTEIKDMIKNDERFLEFSKNIVHVNVKDPDATDLCFVDLPGLIQNADDENLIFIVKDLVESNIQRKNTLIVIAMPMSDDYENNQAVTLAKNIRADPKGNRTIGVMTKPDTLDDRNAGLRDDWIAVLEGTKRVTTHGYFCVRLPDEQQRSRGITRLEVQQNAEHFFNTTLPWNQIDDRTRFGIPNFVDYVSGLLVQLVEESLPSLWNKVEDELLKCTREIAKLPPLSKDHPSTTVMLRVTAFCKAVNDAVSGDKDKHFVQWNRASYIVFKDEIISTTPDFRPFERHQGALSHTGRLVSKTQTEPRELEVVRQIIRRSITWELPGEVPPEATKTLVLQYTSLWMDPAVKCFEKVVQTTTELLDPLLDEHFAQYSNLKSYIRYLTFEERDRCRGEADNTLKKVLRFESIPLFTQNFELLKTRENHWYARYIQERNSRGTHYHANVQPVKHTFEKLPRDPSIDDSEATWSVEDELKLMAKAQAYFDVAHQRIIDYVPLTIEHELNQNFASCIQKVLLDAIFKDSQSGEIDFGDLVSEDPVLAARRMDLGDRMIRLSTIKGKLESFRPPARMASPEMVPSLNPSRSNSPTRSSIALY